MIDSYSLKTSYKYQQLFLLIAIWFYEWWLNNNKKKYELLIEFKMCTKLKHALSWEYFYESWM